MTDIRDRIQRAFEKQRVVKITYRDQAGNETTRLIRPLRWRDPFVILAYCYLREAERHFRIKGIKSCSDVESSEIPDEATNFSDTASGSHIERLGIFTGALRQLDPRKSYGHAIFESPGCLGYHVSLSLRRSWQSPVCKITRTGPSVKPLNERALRLFSRRGFSESVPELEVDFEDPESLADLADWVFAEALGCGDNYELRLVSVDPGKVDPPDAREEAARKHRRFLFWQALTRVAGDGAEDLAFVVFEDVNCPDKVIQFLKCEDVAECEVVRWDSKESRTILNTQAMGLLEERGFTMGEAGNPMLPVQFDDVWKLADLTEWAFTKILDCGDFYEADIGNASWFPYLGYGDHSLKWHLFYHALTRTHMCRNPFVIFEEVNHPSNPVTVRYLRETEQWECEIAAEDESILAKLTDFGFEIAENNNPQIRISGETNDERQRRADLMDLIEQIRTATRCPKSLLQLTSQDLMDLIEQMRTATDAQLWEDMVEQLKTKTDAPNARQKLADLVEWLFVEALGCKGGYTVIIKRASWREKWPGYEQLFCQGSV